MRRQAGGHHVFAKTRRSRGSVKPVSREADGAKRSGLTELRIAGQSRVVMAAVHPTVPHVSELARRSRRALVEERQGGGDRRPPQSGFRAVRAYLYEREFRIEPVWFADGARECDAPES